MPRILAISNQKGGVGKTTTSINLAASLAYLGQPTLLVDLDPQGNTSSGLGFHKDEVSQGTLDMLMDHASLRSVLQPTALDDLHLVPATRQLIGAEVELMQSYGRELRLHRALSDLPEIYDWIILDCPPSLGFLTVNALAAADAVLIPVQAEYYAMEGLGELLRTMSEVRKALNPRLEREGVLATLADGRTNLCRDVIDELRSVFGREVFETVIPRNVKLGEAPSYGKPALSYAPSSAGAQAYLDLARELINRQTSSIIQRRTA
jgi:chromosome partitioning protein